MHRQRSIRLMQQTDEVLKLDRMQRLNKVSVRLKRSAIISDAPLH